MSEPARFWVAGLPETKGSWRGIGKGRMKRDNPREKAWSEAVGWAAKAQARGRRPSSNRIAVTLRFYLPAPKGRKNQRDIDKLCRSVLDSLSGILYVDDEQVDELIARKIVNGADAGPDGVHIVVEEIE